MTVNITKYLHACLLVETSDKTILIDPGNYTYDAKIFPIASLSKLDAIVITHEHMDHMHIPFLHALRVKFPSAELIVPSQTVKTLANEQIASVDTLPEYLTVREIPHEAVFGVQVPQNWEYTLFNTLTHPGDSFHSTQSSRIFALPMQAPWGSLTEAIDLVVRLKPEFVIPIHDWHWKDEARIAFYGWVTSYLKTHNITFIPLETGRTVEL